jgi:hypothetical protein
MSAIGSLDRLPDAAELCSTEIIEYTERGAGKIFFITLFRNLRNLSNLWMVSGAGCTVFPIARFSSWPHGFLIRSIRCTAGARNRDFMEACYEQIPNP